MASTLPFLASGVTDIMPYRIYTNYKCDTECLTGYIEITSVARTLPFLPSGVIDINETGYTQITSVTQDAAQDTLKFQVWHIICNF